jgi:hypothetical protein
MTPLMADESIWTKLLNNTPFTLILSGAFLVLVAAASGFPLLKIQVTELAWRISLAVVGVLFAGIGLWVWWKEKQPVPATASKTSDAYGELLEKILFDYRDSPTSHGWDFSERTEPTQPTFHSFEDGFVGSAIQIKTTARYGLDYNVRPLARLGSFIEFEVKPEKRDSVVYARLGVESKDGTKTKIVWLQFVVGSGQPYAKKDDNLEWTVPLKPVRRDDSWLLFQVDLIEAVAKTFGKKGWRFQQLKGFRVRGNISLAYISVFERK